jgi:peptidoglycan/LPS O-acetylase OafA/YrhL
MFFVQNYVWGWGYAYKPSWSLAVEEHFYFCFSLLLFWGIKRRFIRLNKTDTFQNLSRMEYCVIGTMAVCTMLRLISNFQFPEENARNITMTHLRLDSLLAGVLVAYWYYFKKDWFQHFIISYKKRLLLLSLSLISFTPFIDHEHSFFAKTLGFLMLYMAFSILLSWFLVEEKINILLDKFLSKPVVDGISKIGFASYSIYIIHSFVNNSFSMVCVYWLKIEVSQPLTFLLTSVISIITGLLMTKYIEKYFLDIRDQHFPARNINSKI